MAADHLRSLRIRSLCEALRDHRCIVDGLMTVGECVDSGRCGCCNGLLLKIDELIDPSEALQSNENTS